MPWNQSSQARAERFWRKVKKTRTCWLWIGQRNGAGYGEFAAYGIKRRVIVAHRYAWFLKTGRMPKLKVLHHCDVRRCVRFDHIYEGTQKQNVADAMNRHRRPQNFQFGNRNAASSR